MTAPVLKVDGTITRIVEIETRHGTNFLRVHVHSNKMSIDVDIFNREQRLLLDGAMPGDRLRASGTGYHRGPLHNGTTSLTAKRLRYIRDDAGRAARTRPVQLSLFAA